jgi:beta-N-acetylhexosaminidase
VQDADDEAERAQRPATEARRPSPKQERDALRRLARRLPLDRQVAQLMAISTAGRRPTGLVVQRLRQRDWGVVVLARLNYQSNSQFRNLATGIGRVAQQARHLPPLLAANQEGGDLSTLPGPPPKQEPVVGNAAQAAATARAAARRLRAVGVRMTLAPDADVGVEGGGVQDRVFGETSGVVTGLTRAAVNAYARAGVISAVKHFPGQGAVSQDPELGTATVGLSREQLERRDLRPFAAVARTAPVVIVSNAVYAAWDGVTPAVLLPQVVQELLRKKLKFRGVVMTNDLALTAPITGQNVGQVAVDALRAGADLLFVSGGVPEQDQAFATVVGEVRSGKISRKRIEDSVVRVLALKRRAGLPLPRA